jgi:5-methylcytosine-specific restriction endonuclease McrA
MPRGDAARDRLRSYLLVNVGRVLDSDELREVGRISEWARRVRELRQFEGYDIVTDKDDASLKPGQYLLRSKEPGKPTPTFTKGISKKTRAFIFDRNGFTCQMCGAAAGEPHPSFPESRTRLHLGHILDREHGGSDEAENLRALCSFCNEGAADVTLERPSYTRLASQVRRATREDQIKLLEWLRSKYGAFHGS